MAGSFARETTLGGFAELVVEEREQPIGGQSVTAGGGVHQDRGVFGVRGAWGHTSMIIESDRD